MTDRPIKLTLAYDGTDFAGWQRQKNARSVQEELENALGKMHGHKVRVTGAGRTDSGVHARGQVAGFFTDIASIPAGKFALALNRLLPRDLRILESIDAPAGFHARFDASCRSYRYFIRTDANADPFASRYAWFIHRSPRLQALDAMAGLLRGEKDFSTFAYARDPSPSKCRFVRDSAFWFEGECLVFGVSANAFLWRMVRSLVGSMIAFEAEARGDAAAAREFMRSALESRDRERAGPTAPPEGLFLWSVEYGPRMHGQRIADPEDEDEDSEGGEAEADYDSID